MKKPNFLFVCLMSALICFWTASIAYSQEEMMTNDEVISLATAGLNSSIIVNKIRISKSNFDTSTDALIKLKKAGISDEIINAMLEAKSGKPLSSVPTSESANRGDPNDPLSPHDFGIYLYEERN